MTRRWSMVKQQGNSAWYRRAGLSHILVSVIYYPGANDFTIRVHSYGKEIGNTIYAPSRHTHPLPPSVVGQQARRIINEFRELNT